VLTLEHNFQVDFVGPIGIIFYIRILFLEELLQYILYFHPINTYIIRSLIIYTE